MTEAYPDTLVGTDSHTTMVNGLGVLGWGVGGIEAEAAMLGQPISMLLPQVVGFQAHRGAARGRDRHRPSPDGDRDARERGVVSRVRRVLRPGLSTLGLADSATIGNMSPEFGSTCGIFPSTRRPSLPGVHRPATEQIELVDAYARAQGLFHDGSEDATLSTPSRSISATSSRAAGPKRPQDRRSGQREERLPGGDARWARRGRRGWPPRRPGSPSPLRPAAEDHERRAGKRAAPGGRRSQRAATPRRGRGQLEDARVELDHGMVVIAAITSCTTRRTRR